MTTPSREQREARRAETLDCQKCGVILPINEMYSVDACSENCQNEILRDQELARQPDCDMPGDGYP